MYLVGRKKPLPVNEVHVPRRLEGFPSSRRGTCTSPAGRKPFQPDIPPSGLVYPLGYPDTRPNFWEKGTSEPQSVSPGGYPLALAGIRQGIAGIRNGYPATISNNHRTFKTIGSSTHNSLIFGFCLLIYYKSPHLLLVNYLDVERYLFETKNQPKTRIQKVDHRIMDAVNPTILKMTNEAIPILNEENFSSWRTCISALFKLGGVKDQMIKGEPALKDNDNTMLCAIIIAKVSPSTHSNVVNATNKVDAQLLWKAILKRFISSKPSN
ncbi:hypothetical protein PGT21_033225 [Puccinia graminis f. sp. tritici]|uniref:Uncharacterized protein n=1 Tax=Puccinia graminis f. sp. tritici TaxID=56615 RepID=A0A5B0LZP1_PUCGR|nr:hypothetical protein PGT21_033225 [Puccinia graminis f. sp. tritici]